MTWSRYLDVRRRDLETRFIRDTPMFEQVLRTFETDSRVLGDKTARRISKGSPVSGRKSVMEARSLGRSSFCGKAGSGRDGWVLSESSVNASAPRGQKKVRRGEARSAARRENRCGDKIAAETSSSGDLARENRNSGIEQRQHRRRCGRCDEYVITVAARSRLISENPRFFQPRMETDNRYRARAGKKKKRTRAA